MKEPKVLKYIGDNGNQFEVYQAGKFTWTIDEDGYVLVHNNSGQIPTVVNSYQYHDFDRASDAAWKMASLQAQEVA